MGIAEGVTLSKYILKVMWNNALIAFSVQDFNNLKISDVMTTC